MAIATKSLLAMTAAELMSEDLVLIPQEMSLQGAARLLTQHQVSGGPVVNERGVCIGILSATDFLHWAEDESEPEKARHCIPCEVYDAWQIVEPDILPADTVANYMTADPVTVRPDQRIGELARKMIDAHIHRLVVVDKDNRPVGMVTSTDILAIVAYAGET